MSNIDQQFIEFVVKSLVGKPEAVSVERRIDEKGVLLELTVDPEDLGRVIGKRGATAQSLRTLLRALGTKNDARYNLKIVDNGVGSPGGNSESKPAPRTDKKSTEKTETKPDEDVTEEPAKVDEPVKAEEPAPEAEDKAAPEEATSDRLRKAREELADLDDLDV
jgi:predicted RNA-binding protein YlqC (UPF0109 family)